MAIKRTKRQTIIYKTLHRKLKIEQHEPRLKTFGCKYCIINLLLSKHATVNNNQVLMVYWKPIEEEEEEGDELKIEQHESL